MIYLNNDYPPYLLNPIIQPSDKGDFMVMDAIGRNKHPVVADYGLGSGVYLRKWNALLPHCRLLGADFDVAAAEHRVSNLRVEVIDPKEFLDQTSPLDHINFSHSIEHIADPITTLLHAVARLAGGGTLRIKVPVASSLTFRVFSQHWFALEAPRHFTIPTSHVLIEILVRKLGLRLVFQRFYGSPSVFQRTLSYVIKDPAARRTQLRLACRLQSIAQNRMLAVMAERFSLSSKAEFLFRKAKTD